MWLARDLMASSPLLGGDKGPSGLLASKPGRILRLRPTAYEEWRFNSWISARAPPTRDDDRFRPSPQSPCPGDPNALNR